MMNLKNLKKTVDKIMNGETVIIKKEYLNDIKDEIECLFNFDINYELINNNEYEVNLSVDFD